MKISDNCLKLIKEFEGFYANAYKCPAGIWTIGYGTTNSDKDITGFAVSDGKSISKATAENFLKKTLEARYVPNVNKYHKTYNFNQNQFDALVSFCYNIGSIDQLVGNGKYSLNSVASRILLFDHANGKVLAGLTRRRKAEHNLFVKAVSKSSSNSSSSSSSNVVNYKVTCNSLYIRKGAGTSYRVVGSLKKNDIIAIDYVKGSWGRVHNTSNYVCLSYLQKVSNNSKKSSTSYYVVTCSALNVRKGPGTSYKVVSKLHKGDKVCVCEKKGSWCRINNTNNWFNVNYAKKV